MNVQLSHSSPNLLHIDHPDRRVPLDLVASSANSPAISPAALPYNHCAEIRTGRDKKIYVRLLTDSRHLSEFFVGQWGDIQQAEAAATLFALARPPEYYGVPGHFGGHRTWLQEQCEVWQFGTEYYGTIKVSVRGICSVLATEDELFLHGCALQIGTMGVVLSGVSGAGKTTLTEAIRALDKPPSLIVNDDWGAVSLANRRMYYTGESNLHMKYRSVAALRPDLNPRPEEFASENYEGDATDPHARLLIPRNHVFGPHGIADEAPLSAYVVVFRDPAGQNAIRPLRIEDLARIEDGEYSAFYQRHERFLDGSLFLTSPDAIASHRAKLRRLVSSVPAWLVNNAGSPAETAQCIVKALHSGS